jgi:hypothetical protein
MKTKNQLQQLYKEIYKTCILIGGDSMDVIHVTSTVWFKPFKFMKAYPSINCLDNYLENGNPVIGELHGREYTVDSPLPVDSYLELQNLMETNETRDSLYTKLVGYLKELYEYENSVNIPCFDFINYLDNTFGHVPKVLYIGKIGLITLECQIGRNEISTANIGIMGDDTEYLEIDNQYSRDIIEWVWLKVIQPDEYLKSRVNIGELKMFIPLHVPYGLSINETNLIAQNGQIKAPCEGVVLTLSLIQRMIDVLYNEILYHTGSNKQNLLLRYNDDMWIFNTKSFLDKYDEIMNCIETDPYIHFINKLDEPSYHNLKYRLLSNLSIHMYGCIKNAFEKVYEVQPSDYPVLIPNPFLYLIFSLILSTGKQVVENEHLQIHMEL